VPQSTATAAIPYHESGTLSAENLWWTCCAHQRVRRGPAAPARHGGAAIGRGRAV
jgi:hypothetical protein